MNPGDKYILKHTPGWLSEPIIIPCTIVKLGTGKNEHRVKVDTEHQKGIIVLIKDLLEP